MEISVFEGAEVESIQSQGLYTICQYPLPKLKCPVTGSVWTLGNYSDKCVFPSQFCSVQSAMDSLCSRWISPSHDCQRSVEQSELLLGDGKNFIGRDWCHDSEIQPHTHPHTLILIQLSVAESYDCPKCNVYYRLTPGDIEWEGKLNNSRGKELGPGNAKDYQYLLFQGPE